MIHSMLTRIYAFSPFMIGFADGDGGGLFGKGEAILNRFTQAIIDLAAGMAVIVLVMSIIIGAASLIIAYYTQAREIDIGWVVQTVIATVIALTLIFSSQDIAFKIKSAAQSTSAVAGAGAFANVGSGLILFLQALASFLFIAGLTYRALAFGLAMANGVQIREVTDILEYILVAGSILILVQRAPSFVATIFSATG